MSVVYPEFPKNRRDFTKRNFGPSFKNGFKIVIGFMFMILSVVFGATLNYETTDLQLKVFACFLAFLHGIFILIQVNDKSAT